MSSGKIYNDLYNIFNLDKPDYNEHGVNWVVIDEQLEKIFYVGGQLIAILATLITLLFTIVVCLEIMYICVPFLRRYLDGGWDDTNNYIKRNQGMHIAGYGMRRVYRNFFMKDARIALDRANTTETGKSPMMIYLGIKIKQFIIVALAFYIATNLDMFINLVLNVVGPAIDYIKLLLHTR